MLEYKQRQKQTQEQRPPAARKVRKVSLNVRVKKITAQQQEDTTATE